MTQLTPSYLVSNDLTEDQVTEINELLEDYQDDRFWTRRLSLGLRSRDGSSCAYDFMGHTQMSQELRRRLYELAPKIDGHLIGEIAINRYNVGDYIGIHKDRDFYRMNKVISLQAKGDGLYIEDEDRFIEDAVGQAVTINGVGPVHSVPPVKHKRHVFIVLYE